MGKTLLGLAGAAYIGMFIGAVGVVAELVMMRFVRRHQRWTFIVLVAIDLFAMYLFNPVLTWKWVTIFLVGAAAGSFGIWRGIMAFGRRLGKKDTDSR